MSILVVGSIALDTVQTPYGQASDSPGGSALYFSAAASLFTKVRIVGVIGKDFDLKSIQFLKERGADFSGLEVEEGLTFRWGGRYHKNLNHRDTLFTYLNVFEKFQPRIPEHYKDSRFVFLANIDPELQLHVLDEMPPPELSVLDTMNFWISGKPHELEAVIKRVDILILNDEEIRELTGIHNIFEAGSELLSRGPRALVIKKGEHGAVLMTPDGYFFSPAFPLKQVVDPTGAGDSFAGGLLGYLAVCDKITDEELRRAVIYGTIVASYNVEDFSFRRLKEITREDVENRLQQIRDMMRF